MGPFLTKNQNTTSVPAMADFILTSFAASTKHSIDSTITYHKDVHIFTGLTLEGLEAINRNK